MLDEDLIFSSQEGSADNMKTFVFTVKLQYRNNYIMAAKGIYGDHKYVFGLIRGTVVSADAFSSKSAFGTELLNVWGFLKRENWRKIKLANSVELFM